ncbi:MAG: long-chain-fatty-acid--CoA ligase [Actinobacteria bacterium]|nr:long-chain-fatty-acid--CoA ligase [Actinomycetota bacterium]OJU81894.1 MAG: acyl-CoA synthetase [Solirubrobacterales bacterium 70-9]
MTAPDDQSLSPLSFLIRSAAVWGDREAVRDGRRSWTYAEHHARVERLAGGLRTELGVEDGDRVALLLPNVPAALELHYAVPGAGAVIVPLNTRLAAAEYRYILEHSGASVVFCHRSLEGPCAEAVEGLPRRPRVVRVGEGAGGDDEYEGLAATAARAELRRPRDERALLSINYTSGTTGRPKGVMVSHRGAYLHSLGQVIEAGLTTRSRYLWTLPMFHCNGWCYTWAVTAAGAAHLCVPSVDPDALWQRLREERVSHFCAAPVVINMLLESEAASPCPEPVRAFVGGAPPSPALLERAEQLNFAVTHLYGLTETYGPLMICAWNPAWDDLSVAAQARLRARQGVPTIVSERARVVDAEMRDVPADGETTGEIVMRGNNVMLGYYRDPEATVAAFSGDWFHSGDAGVMHPDGYIELRDRLKDVIVSGGENIAAVEIEQILVEHPNVAEAAVVGLADERWGEVPVAFVTPRGGGALDPDELREFARSRLAGFKLPRRVEVVDDLPRTATGKVQKFVLRDRLSGGEDRPAPSP